MRAPERFYSPELARIHATGFASAWDPAAAYLAELARVPTHACFVSDVGCGDGHMLHALRELGIPGWGCDISAAFVMLARARGLEVEQCDAAAATLPPSTLVIALGEVLAYEDEHANTSLEAVANEAWARLVPGGHLAFDLPGPSTPASQGWREGPDWFVASRSTIAADVLEREIVTFTSVEATWRRISEVHRQRLYEPDWVVAVLDKLGFQVGQLDCIGEAPLLPGRFAILASRPK
jgi:SAM-dependent methyltransferase